MEIMFRLLRYAISKGDIDPNDFYDVEFRSNEILLQGHANRKNIAKYEKLFGKPFEYNDKNRWLSLEESAFNITLTID